MVPHKFLNLCSLLTTLLFVRYIIAQSFKITHLVQVKFDKWFLIYIITDGGLLRKLTQHGLVPVSYTHLDVYKRQTIDKRGQSYRFNNICIF